MGAGGITWRMPGRRVLLVVFCAFLPLGILAGFSVLEAVRSYRMADEARLRGTVRALADAVDARLAAAIATVGTLSHGPMLDAGADLGRFVAHARSVVTDAGGWVAAIGPPPDHGVEAHTLDQGPAVQALLEAAAVRAALEAPLRHVFRSAAPAITDLFVGPVSGEPVLAVLAPVRRGGQVIRALAITVRPAVLLDLLARQDLPPDSFAAITDGRFRILAESRDSDGRLVGATAPDWLRQAVAGQQRGLLTGPGLGEVATVFAFETLVAAPGWIVVVAHPLVAQRAGTWRVLGWALGAAAALLLGLTGVGWVVGRQALQATRQEAAALRAGRAEVERLLGGLPAFIFLRDVAPDGSSRVLYRAGDTQAVFGLSAEQVAAIPHLTTLGAAGTPTLDSVLRRALRDGSTTLEWRIRQPDGGGRWLRSRFRCLSCRPEGGGEVVGYTQNITAERAAVARAAASGRLAALGEMAAGLAHELKQPLAIISLAAENAARSLRAGKPGRAPARLDRIAQQAARAGELIEHLRRFASGAETGEAPVPVSLARAVDGALALVGGSLRDAGVALEVALGPRPGPVVMAQLVPLEQVLANLLGNARDAFASNAASGAPAGAPRRVRIAARCDAAAGQVRITVEDTAGGIAPQVLERLFEPFVTTKDAEKGTGLGLSICHGLVGGMGGSIEACNGAAGAAFTITLAAAPSPAAALPVVA